MPSLHNAQLRHAQHYLDTLRTANGLYVQGGEAIKLGLNMVDTEWENIQLGQNWSVANMWQEAEAAEICSNYPIVGMQLLTLRQRPQEKIRWLESALAGSRHLKRRGYQGAHLVCMGLAYMEIGEYNSAIICQEEALEIAREIRDRNGEAAALTNLGLAYAQLGEVQLAKQYHEKALAVYRWLNDPRNRGFPPALAALFSGIPTSDFLFPTSPTADYRLAEGIALGNLATEYIHMGDFQHAIELLKQFLSISRKAGNRRCEGDALRNLSVSYFELGKPRLAKKHAEQALFITREIGDRRAEGLALICLGNAYSKLGRPQQGLQLFEESLPFLREVNDRYGEDIAMSNIKALGSTRRQSFEKVDKKWWEFWK